MLRIWKKHSICCAALLAALAACEMQSLTTSPLEPAPEGVSTQFDATVVPEVAVVRNASDLNRYYVKIGRSDTESRVHVQVFKATTTGLAADGSATQWNKLRTLAPDESGFEDRDIVAGEDYEYRFFGMPGPGGSPLLHSLSVEVPLDKVISGYVDITELTGRAASVNVGRLLFEEGSALVVWHYGLFLNADEVHFLKGARITVRGVELGPLPDNDFMTIAITTHKVRGHVDINLHNGRLDALYEKGIPPGGSADLRAFQSPSFSLVAKDTTGFSYKFEKPLPGVPELEAWRRYLSDTIHLDLPSDNHFLIDGNKKIAAESLGGVYQGPNSGAKKKALYFWRGVGTGCEMTVLEGGKFSIHWNRKPRTGGLRIVDDELKLLERVSMDTWELREQSYRPVAKMASKAAPALVRFDKLDENIQRFNTLYAEAGRRLLFWTDPPTIVTADVEAPNDVAEHQLELTELMLKTQGFSDTCRRHGIEQFAFFLAERDVQQTSHGNQVVIPYRTKLSATEMFEEINRGRFRF